MLFNRNKLLIESLQLQIDMLREQNKDLHDRLMAFTQNAFQNYINKKSIDKMPDAPQWVDPVGQIQSMDATTDEEKKQKAAAIQEAQAILGGGIS